MTPVVFRIRELRAKKKWTQQELAERSGARQATISDMENGKAKRVDLDVLEGLARAFDCDVGDLMAIDPDARKRRGKG